MSTIKNFKKIIIIFSIFLALFLSIGLACASEDNSGNASLEISSDECISQEPIMDDSSVFNREILSDFNESNDIVNSANGDESIESFTPESNITTDEGSGNDSQIIEAPKLIKVQYYPNGDNYYAKFCWISNNGSTYDVLRKDTGDFEVISTVTATSSQMTYYDKITDNCSYSYSVREVIEGNGSERINGSYDAEGLKLLACPDVAVDFQNLMANVTWDRIDNASNYRIFRKMGRDGSFKCIAVVDANQSSYVDYYYNSVDEFKGIISCSVFVEPSFNNLFYTVRACNIRNDNAISYGLYLKDGDFNLESPSVVSLINNTIRWGKVPNADGYSILKKVDGNWEVIAQALKKTTTTLSLKLGDVDKDAYYSVQAYALKNGEMVYSKFDEGFSLMNYSQDNSQYRILYFGNSITYGSPYKALSSRHIFSIPYRVGQLLGCVYYNPSIPGSTYHDLGQIDGINIENGKYYRYRICREVVDAIYEGELPGNWEELDSAKNSEGLTNTRLDEYNVVVLAAGTNDYLDKSVLGSEDSNDTSTFNGAFNHIMEKIENASQMRVERGQTPIKVVFVDLYYSDRTSNYKVRTNRDITPNKLGLTLMDYQNELDKQFVKWQNKSEYLTFYNFDTRSYGIVNEENCPYTSSDNLHFTKYTYTQYGNAFAKYLLENVFDDNATENIAAPNLLKVQYYPNGNNYYAKFCWISNPGSTYEVLRKDTEDFDVIATVTADSAQMTYYDKIANNCSYTYSVREVIDESNGERIYGPYDVEGLKLLACPNVVVDFQNLVANVTWDKIEDATAYRIFRKVGRDASFKCIAVVDSNQSCYADYYYNSVDELSSILNSKTFADPAFNSLFYTVRAVKTAEINGSQKTSYGLYLKDGDFNLIAPTIVSLINNTIRWGKVPNADGYSILKKVEDKWEIIAQAKQKTSTTISKTLDEVDNDSYYSVQAYSLKNGEMVYSKFDEGFSLMNYSQDNSKYRILYFGDSITYGSPYKAASSRHIFSIPYRVGQLLGCVYYNPSIPGSTYHDLGQIDGVNIENTKYYRYRICREVVDAIYDGELPGNWENLDTAKNSEGITNTRLDEYNIVVLAAGTNDYTDKSVLGSEDSNDTSTFNGAFNHIMEKIENASQMRIERGESPIKVVFVDLYYSDCIFDYKVRNNRDVTPNRIGLTLMDYQNELNKQYVKWQNQSEYLTLYKFETRSYGIVDEENCPYTASDNLHYTKFTYGQYGNEFAKFLLDKVFRNKTSLSVNDLVMDYNDEIYWNVTLTDGYGNFIPDAEIKVTVSENESYILVTDINGSASLPINFTPGTYVVNATYEGSPIYQSSFANATIVVNKIGTTLSGEDLSMTYTDGSSWNVTLTDADGAAITGVKVKIGLKIGSSNIVYSRMTNSEGTVSLPINLAPGTYVVNATYEDSPIYESAFINATIVVNKIGTTLSGEDLSMTYTDGSSWNVTLTDADGAAITGVKVKIGLKIGSSNKVYSRMTNSEGTVSLPINLAPGTYAINATYDGDSKHGSAFISYTITVDKAILILNGHDLVMGYKDGSSYKVNLTDGNSNPISNVVVKFTIGNSSYDSKTDINGTASLPINLRLGNYTVKASIFDSKYKSNSITNSINVNADNLNISASDVNMTYKDGTAYEVQLVDGEGCPVSLAGQIIKTTIKNKTYFIKTNSKGIAKLTINLNAGNYIVESIYNNITISNNITVNA